MTDDSVQREIEANQRRARDEEDVGIDENVLVEQEQEGTIFDDMADTIFGGDAAPSEDDHEYTDNTKAQDSGSGV